jgi:hypothetical protein
MGVKDQLGVVDEGTYGTPVTVSRFFEFRSAPVKLDLVRIPSQARRAGRYNVGRSSAYASHKRGALGDVVLEAMNKGFGFWLKHMLGAVGTTGPVSTAYTHTGSIATLVGDSFTMQIGREQIDGTVQAFTYHGGKLNGWEIACEAGGLAVVTLNCDFEDEDTSIGLAAASYPTGLVPFSFVDGSLLVAGSAIHVRSASVVASQNLATERYFLRASGLKKEPLDRGRDYSGTVVADFESLTAYNRFVNGTEATLNLKFEGGTIAGAEKFTLTIDAPVVRFDGETPESTAEPISQPLPFKILEDSLTIAFKSTDATP